MVSDEMKEYMIRYWDSTVNLMDVELLEDVLWSHMDGITKEEILDEYIEKHRERYDEDFSI